MIRLSTGSVAATLALLSASAAHADTARYRITADTNSGLGAGMGSMLGGGGPGHTLSLQLGSGTTIAAPEGEHIVPPNLNAGRSLPLIAERRADGGRGSGNDDPLPAPKTSAKLRIYWGCGETPGANQPRVLDGAAIMKQGGFGGMDIRLMSEWSAASFRSYGAWPNTRDAKQLPGSSSLAGDHMIRANFSPEMRFTLGADRDFLAPLSVAQTKADSGATALSWTPVARSRGYLLTVMGAAKDGAAIIWTSSAVPLATFTIAGHLDPAEITRLLAARALLPSDARTCTVPAAVMKEIDTPVLQMAAFGEEANIAEPKPASAPATWAPAWTVKLRYKSSTMMMLGAEGGMPQFGDAASGNDEPPVDVAPAPKKRGGLLGKIGARALGL